MQIVDIKGIEIFDSRGVPTLEVHCLLDDGSKYIASVPSGAFAGLYEAAPTKDITTAINNINNVIAPMLKGKDPSSQEEIDTLMISTDGTENKQHLGGNTIIGVSMAVARAGAQSKAITLAEHLAQLYNYQSEDVSITPLFNIINGGAHADNNLTFQEFMVIPLELELSFIEKMKQGRKVFLTLKKRLEEMKKSTNVGDEGGFAPELNSNEEAIEILIEAIQESGFVPGKDFGIGLDIAAGGIPDLMIATYPKQPMQYYQDLINDYPVVSLEDPFKDDDWENWSKLTASIGSRISIVGDDFFSTNPKRLKQGIEQKAANSISIKPNQIGTISETLQTIKLAKENNYDFQISHRAGETEDTFISDLAIATKSRYIKAGAPNRGERIAKYNQIIRITQ